MSAAVEERVEAALAFAALDLVDSEHPWLGLDSFSEETRQFFHGREEEIAELARRVQGKLLTILFGQSGLGKTSILRAGIVPRLRRAGFCPVYVRVDYSPNSPSPSEQIKRVIFRETEALGEWSRPGSAVEGETLWEFLHHRDDVLRDANDRVLTPLLIFDQFEEIFTIGQGDDFGRRRAVEFIEDLADLVENRPPATLEQMLDSDDSVVERFDFDRADYRILISLREDYLANLEAFRGSMPSVTQNRMRLARMTGQQALAAVTKPGGRLVTEEVAESIVRFVAGGAELRNAEVEPSLLSLICRELNNTRVAQGRPEISADLLAGSRETILQEFYERTLRDQPPGVRRFIEDEMLTESGFRESLAEERVARAFAAASAPAGALAALVNRRLLRIEERLDLRRVELTHDVLCKVVLESRDARHQREAREEMERQLAAQKAQQLATRKALVRARQVAAGCGILAIGAVASAIWGFTSMQRAQEAEARVETTLALAERARGQSERLAVYLLDDFYIELAPVGRLDLVQGIADRTLEYYGGLPPELRNGAAERNHAIALWRKGSIAGATGKSDQAVAHLDRAFGIVDGLRKGGDASDETLLAWANVRMAQAVLRTSSDEWEMALQLAQESLAAVRPLAAKPAPVRGALAAQGQIMTGLGWMRLRRGGDGAAEILREAQATYRQMGAMDSANIPAAAGYAIAGIWLGETLTLRESNDDEALPIFDDVESVSRGILKARPDHQGAIRSLAFANNMRGEILARNLRPASSLPLQREAEAGWRRLTQIDPDANSNWNNLGVSMNAEGWGLFLAGKPEESLRKRQGLTALAEKMRLTNFNAINFAYWNVALAANYIELDRPRETAAALEVAREFRVRGFRQVEIERRNPGQERWEHFRRQVAIRGGNFREALADSHEALQRMDQMKPDDPGPEALLKRLRADTHADIARCAYWLGEYTAAEAAARKATSAFAEAKGPLALSRQREIHDNEVFLAAAIARQGRATEAASIIRPAVEFHRGLHAKRHEDVTQHVDFARALMVQALATPDARRALLGEAAAVFDRLAPDVRRLKSNARLREEIAAQQGRSS